jgi:hypothetical protein
MLTASCGTTVSEINNSENGTYVISASGYASAQNNIFPILYDEANSYCNKKGMIFKSIACDGDFKPGNSTRVKLIFQCM